MRKGLGIRPLKSGGSGILTFSKTHPSVMPAALEAGTLNGHGIAGLGAAVRWLKEQGADRLRAREQRLAGRFYELVQEIPDVRIYGDFSAPERAAIVSLNLGGEDSARVSDWLAWEHGIFTRAGGHCAPLMHGAWGPGSRGRCVSASPILTRTRRWRRRPRRSEAILNKYPHCARMVEKDGDTSC